MGSASSPRIRVLVVDDSPLIRQLLADTLSGEPDMEFVGAAPNGALALTLMPRLAPDVVVLDIDMPVLNGLEFLTRLRPSHPRLPVIVFSSFATHGAETTMQALWLGASDYVAKPSAGGVDSVALLVRTELLPRIRAFARTGIAPLATAARPAPFGSPHTRAGVLAIGASTGGPCAIAQVLQGLPRDFPLPILIVQHMPPVFTRHLADGLSSQCDLVVREATHGDALVPGTAWVAPGDQHMSVAREGGAIRLLLDRSPFEHSCRPSLNPLLRSVAATFGSATLAVVLTGMGQDGIEGARAVHEAGGQLIVQDEESSVVWGMPGTIARAGLADLVLPLDDIAAAVLLRCRRAGGRRAA